MMEANSVKTLNGNSLKERNNMKIEQKCDVKKTKPYRLTIQINKVYLRPCPKSKKINQINTNSGNVYKEAEERLQNLKCLVCKKEFSSASALYEHVKEHFICDICDAEFSSQKSIKKHIKIHLSENSQHPYRCHVCEKLFTSKEAVKKHPHVKLGKYDDTNDGRIHYCDTCKKSFTNEIAFRKHLASHFDKSSEAQVPNQKMTSLTSQLPTFAQLRPVLFNCRICNQNFNNLADIDKHTKLHMQNLESKN